MSDPSLGASDGSITNKRKRESDSAGPDPQRMNRSSNGSNGSIPAPDPQPNFTHGSLSSYEHGLPSTATDLNIDQQILQHVGPQNGISDENALTAKAALAAHNPQNKYPPPPEPTFDANNLTHNLTFGEDMGQSMGPAHGHSSTAAAVYAAREAQSMNQKPSVGSPEWHQIRKNNHKEVERRRREAINEGINQLARIVPNCDKNKGAILQRTIEYVCQLHDEKKAMAERWEQNNMTTSHAISEISAQNSKLKLEVNRRGDIAQKWIQRCRDAGLEFDDYNDGDELEPLEVDQGQV